MNSGILGFPAQRANFGPVKILATLKLVGTGVTTDGAGPTAGRSYSQSAVKSSYNVDKVVYNAAGDFTVYFINPPESQHYVMMGMCRSQGGTDYFVQISENDTDLADRKRVETLGRNSGVPANISEVHLIFFA